MYILSFQKLSFKLSQKCLRAALFIFYILGKIVYTIYYLGSMAP